MRKPDEPQICDDGVALDEAASVETARCEPPPIVRDLHQAARSRAMGRKLRHDGVGDRSSGVSLRFDPPQRLFDELHELSASPMIMPTERVAGRRDRPSPRAEGGQFVAWMFALCGAATLGSGIGTIAWSLWAARPDLWNPAIGLTLAGQGILIFGLVMIVTRLWRNSRFAASELQQVHQGVRQLQRTADALSANRTGGSPDFYGDLVRGASPQMLLANLKGQLDQLAARISGGR